ncbi:MAG: hypothetical protein QHH75_12580 [Bacillota bacterium]|nr:hypothetical protein [Bacillota bacterium]
MHYGQTSDTETLVLEPTCPRCGIPVQTGQRFCRKCGYAFADSGNTATFLPVDETYRAKLPVRPSRASKGWKIIWLLPVLVVLCGLALAVVAYLQGYILDRQAPQVTITSPAWDKELNLNSTNDPVVEVIEVKARDNRRVESLELLLNGISIKSVKGLGSLVCKWETTLEGKYTFKAVAYDRCGNQSESLPLVINVRKSFPEQSEETVYTGEALQVEKQVVEGFLYKWVDTMRDKDLVGHMACYADNLVKYYTQYNVPKDQVYNNKMSTFARYDVIEMNIDNININFDNVDHAIATFNKQWDTRGQETFSGEVLQKLELRKINGEWLITSEEELQIYRATRNGENIN